MEGNTLPKWSPEHKMQFSQEETQACRRLIELALAEDLGQAGA